MIILKAAPLLLAIVLFLSLSFRPMLPASVSAQMNCDQFKRGIVKIVATRSQPSDSEVGAGIVVGSDEGAAFVITALHVVKDASSIRTSFFHRPGEEFDSRVIKLNEALDIAVIRVGNEGGRTLPRDLPTFRLGGSPAEGSKVSTIGHPAGLDWQCYLNTDTVSRLNYEGDFRKFLFTAPSLRQGNSGGPIFDTDGLLIGMVIARLGSGDGVGVRLDAIEKILIQEWGVQTSGLFRPPPKTNRDLCIEGRSGSCLEYGEALMKECGEAPTVPGPQTGAYLDCNRKAQCWKNRGIWLMQLEEARKYSGEGSQAYLSLVARGNELTAEKCEKPRGRVF